MHDVDWRAVEARLPGTRGGLVGGRGLPWLVHGVEVGFMVGRRMLAVGTSAMVTGVAMGAARLVAEGRPASWHPAVVTRWYEQNQFLIGWRVVLLAVAAIGLVAFAMCFREATWSAAPQWLWVGTTMVLAALGYAAMTSAAAAMDLATLWALESRTTAQESVGFGAHAHRSLRVLATPGLVVVLLAAAPWLVRQSLAGQAAAVGAIGVSAALLIPGTWQIGGTAAAVWFLLVGVVAVVPGAPDGTTDVEPATDRPDGGDRERSPSRG